MKSTCRWTQHVCSKGDLSGQVGPPVCIKHYLGRGVVASERGSLKQTPGSHLRWEQRRAKTAECEVIDSNWNSSLLCRPDGFIRWSGKQRSQQQWRQRRSGTTPIVRSNQKNKKKTKLKRGPLDRTFAGGSEQLRCRCFYNQIRFCWQLLEIYTSDCLTPCVSTKT